MKKIVKYFLLAFCILSIGIDVYAQEYKTNELINVDSVATVETDMFLYQDFLYNSLVDSKGNATITFGNIKNKTTKKAPISIDILLFDEKQENIGFLTYCTTKDLDSEYAMYELGAGSSSAFKVTVNSKYFVADKRAKDVRYIAVMDENKYCQIGGYRKYGGLKINQIVDGSVADSKKSNSIDMLFFLKDKKMRTIIGICLGILLFFTITGSILSSLHVKIYGKSSNLAFLPIFDYYIIVKLAFGKIVGLIYFVALIGSSYLVYQKNFTLFIVLNVVAGISLIVAIIRSFVIQHGLIKSNKRNNSRNSTTDSGNFVNLNYSNDYSQNDQVNSNSSNTGMSDVNISVGSSTLDDDDFGGVESQPGVGNIENKEGESDLSKFFR